MTISAQPLGSVCAVSPVNGLRTGVPPFAEGSRRIADAYRFARGAHEGPRRRADTTIEHPAAVAALLHEAGYPEYVIVAALLHDVVEDTTTEVGELASRFGPDVARLVAQLTEDPGIESYIERKGELRERAAADGHAAAAIFAADKLASARQLNAAEGVPEPEKLEHYERTVRALARHHPEVPFLEWLEAEVAQLRARSRSGSSS
jgi:(p)ppGpp synthase/HD superfamily hydrolase